MIVLFALGNKALSLGRPCCQSSPNRVKDPHASASHAVRQSEGEQRVKLRELSKQNSELSTKPRATRKRGVELRQELEICPIKDWWEAPVDRLSLEKLKLHKRRYEGLSKMLIQAIGDQKADSHSNNSDNPPRAASKGISMSLK
ncbi:hypothetical protein NL676_023540 [Syzygium grande]|nr:hypothetical protein NL676_023540 [Syzygium grande]